MTSARCAAAHNQSGGHPNADLPHEHIAQRLVPRMPKLSFESSRSIIFTRKACEARQGLTSYSL